MFIHVQFYYRESVLQQLDNNDSEVSVTQKF